MDGYRREGDRFIGGPEIPAPKAPRRPRVPLAVLGLLIAAALSFVGWRVWSVVYVGEGVEPPELAAANCSGSVTSSPSSPPDADALVECP